MGLGSLSVSINDSHFVGRKAYGRSEIRPAGSTVAVSALICICLLAGNAG
jgi:hypothetical protein